MEDGETAAQAAVRELREETGYCGTVGRVSTVCYSDPGMTGELNSTRVPMFPMIRLHAHPGIFVHEGAPVLHPNPAHTISHHQCLAPLQRRHRRRHHTAERLQQADCVCTYL